VKETVELTDIVLRVIGAFYAFAGVVATRSAMMSRFLDQALADITLQKPKPAETARSVWMFAGAALVLAGGVFLLAGLKLAAWTFAASALAQASYIYVVAPRYLDAEDPPDAQGRQQTTNAFVIYTAATAFILWAEYRGRLASVGDVSTATLVAVGGALLLYAGYLARALWWSPRRSRASDDGAVLRPFPEAPSLPPHESKRIKVMADYQCDPLWALDEERYGCFAPEMIDLSPQLATDLNAWAVAFDTSLNMDDPATGNWSDAQYADHVAEGRRLAGRLKRERPDLMVYVMEPDIGVVEIHPDEPI
jgi:hypothetical protein